MPTMKYQFNIDSTATIIASIVVANKVRNCSRIQQKHSIIVTENEKRIQ